REDTAVALAERPDLALASHLEPAHRLHPDRIENAFLQERKEVLPRGVLEEQHQVSDAGVAVIERLAGVPLEFCERRLFGLAERRFKWLLPFGLLCPETARHVEQMAQGDVGLALVRQWQRFGQPLRRADLRVEGQLLAAGELARLAVGEQDAERGARLGLGTGEDVEGLLRVAVLVPLADDVSLPNNHQPRPATAGHAALPADRE